MARRRTGTIKGMTVRRQVCPVDIDASMATKEAHSVVEGGNIGERLADGTQDSRK